MTQKILTIAIPTYNRAGLLKTTLENLILQVKKDNLEDYVDFLISDNASEDNTKEIVFELSKQYSNLINYNRNPENVVWENIKIAAEKSTGKYVWLCSDDEQFSDGVVKKIIEVAKKNIYKFIYLNIDQNFDNKYIKICNIDEDLECSPSELINRTGISLTTLTCCVLRKDIIENIPTNFVTWYHFEKAFCLNKNDKCYIIANPYIHYVAISSWNTKEKRIKYYTELFSLIMLSAQPKEVKDGFLKAKSLRSLYNEDIISYLNENNNLIDIFSLGKMLKENCKQSHCNYFKEEISLLNKELFSNIYIYIYIAKHKLKKYIREVKDYVRYKGKRAKFKK